MPLSEEFQQPAPGIFLWQAYDPVSKTDLFSTAILTASGLYLIDPIPLIESATKELVEPNEMAGVVVTNANHFRAAADYGEQLSVPILTRESCGSQIGTELRVITIDGAVEGEIALFYSGGGGGALVVGDALINVHPYGFDLLPRKYCANQKEMRRSLRQLLDLRFDQMFFAHGEPILSGAANQLARLLNVEP